MFSDRYLPEKILRWAFSVGLVALLGLSFFNSELYRRQSWWLSGAQSAVEDRASRSCFFQISRDPQLTAGIGFPQFESLVRRARSEQEAIGYVQEACRQDANLKFVYLWEQCESQAQPHKKVGCGQ